MGIEKIAGYSVSPRWAWLSLAEITALSLWIPCSCFSEYLHTDDMKASAGLTAAAWLSEGVPLTHLHNACGCTCERWLAGV